MKNDQLEYRRRNKNQQFNRLHHQLPLRKNILIQNDYSQPDDFLQSAESFYKKNSNMSFHTSNKLKGFNPLNKKYQQLSKSKVSQTHQTLRQSIEKDKTNHLDYWRKQAFQYQQKMFEMQKQLEKIKKQNIQLKQQIIYLKNKNHKLYNSANKQVAKIDLIASQTSFLQVIKSKNQQIHRLNTQLASKLNLIKQLQGKSSDRVESFPVLQIKDFSFAQDTARWSGTQENSTVVSKNPIEQEQFNKILQKLGKNIQQLDFTKTASNITPNSNND